MSFLGIRMASPFLPTLLKTLVRIVRYTHEISNRHIACSSAGVVHDDKTVISVGPCTVPGDHHLSPPTQGFYDRITTIYFCQNITLGRLKDLKCRGPPITSPVNPMPALSWTNFRSRIKVRVDDTMLKDPTNDRLEMKNRHSIACATVGHNLQWIRLNPGRGQAPFIETSLRVSGLIIGSS